MKERNTRVTPISLQPEIFKKLEQQRGWKNRSFYIAELIENAGSGGHGKK